MSFWTTLGEWIGSVTPSSDQVGGAARAIIAAAVGYAVFTFVLVGCIELRSIIDGRRSLLLLWAIVAPRRHGGARIAAQPLLVEDDGGGDVFEQVRIRLAVMRHELLHHAIAAGTDMRYR
jgi:hypothetical protein